MKKYLIPAAGLLAFAVQAQDVGRVISSVPVIQQVAVQRPVCVQQPVAVQQSSGGGAVLGAVLGGLIGNQIGHGGGRAAATGLGVIGGAMLGDNLEGRNAGVQNVQQCHTQTMYENQAVGYNVTYEFGGRQYTVQMPNDPGPTIPVQVTPVGMGQQPYSAAPATIQSYTTVVPSAVYPSYAYPAYPRYYGPPPVSLHLGYVRHRHHRHWR
jgi:uncharacterized protein YcfJ